MKKIKAIFQIVLPALLMIALIPFITNDYLLSLIYAAITGIILFIRRKQYDFLALFLGIFVMTFFEYIFVTTGVEIFKRNTLFGVMPLWLPILWGYGFVAIKRSLMIIIKN